MYTQCDSEFYVDTREYIWPWQEKQSTSVAIDGSTAASELHSEVVEASATDVASTSWYSSLV